jgi:hypothetical protein
VRLVDRTRVVAQLTVFPGRARPRSVTALPKVAAVVMSDFRITPPSMADPPKGEREFVDAEGALWRVYEQPVSDYDRRRGTSLIFASEAAVRRVRAFPADWQSLSDEELVLLSWMA